MQKYKYKYMFIYIFLQKQEYYFKMYKLTGISMVFLLLIFIVVNAKPMSDQDDLKRTPIENISNEFKIDQFNNGNYINNFYSTIKNQFENY